MSRVPMYDAMATMFNHAKGTMQLPELDALATLAEHASDEARRLSSVCGGLACLVEDDASKGRCGSFHDDAAGLFDLLCALSHSFDTIAGMAHVGDEARFLANERRAAEGRVKP